MTNEQRMIVSALRAQNMGYGAIARKVGISENTVKSFLPQEREESKAGTTEHQHGRASVPVLWSACGAERRPQGEKVLL